jgi:hypothetical protein
MRARAPFRRSSARILQALASALPAGCGALVAACGSADREAAELTAYQQGYALVHWQADRLKNIDRLLLVKIERDVVEQVTKEVALLSANVASELETYAATHGIALEREFLPPIEAGARNRMGSNIAGELLLSSGCDFEQRLVFTEAVAVLRLSSLAEEMREQAPDDDQERLWAGIAAKSNVVFERVRELINRCGE